MHALIKEFLSWPSDERKQVILTALFPYETKQENRQMWIRIAMWTIFSIIVFIRILSVMWQSTNEDAHFWTIVLAFPISFDILYWCIFVQMANAVRGRVEEERQKRVDLFEKMMIEQKKAMFEKLRAATGRENLNMDPISIIAAAIDANKPKDSDVDPSVNPLRAALDGTLRPEHIRPPDEDDHNKPDFT